MALINETNAQYYSGQQTFESISSVVNPTLSCTFNTQLVSAFDSSGNQIGSLSNYTVYLDGVGVSESSSFIREGNTIELIGTYTASSVYVQLKNFAIEDNYGGYSYTKLDNIVGNFMIAYVGDGKLIPSAKRTDVIFHAKRGLQEFSYDTLKSIKSQELTIPPSLSIPIPQDYVNYVRLSYIDDNGVKRIIYPVNNLTTSPTELPIQDADGIPTQNSFGENNEAEQSITEERWNKETQNNITGEIDDNETNVYDWSWWKLNFGQRYGLEPQVSQKNGWFQINERTGCFTFSSGLVNQLIVLEYISDGLAYDMDSKVPKMAEEALYAHINYSILSTRVNIPEYIVQRYKKERSAKLRNAKIRLSNIKISEIAQVFRGKSKWLKF
tara:strand:- start:18701 stop:19849 length:1149 start_codon:yes stop_codon:yes gene_type:complete